MIKTNKLPIVEKFFLWWTQRTLAKLFYAHRVRGLEHLKGLDKNIPIIFYANHSNWWDGLLCFYMTYKLFELDTILMMDIKQLRKYAFFRWIGAFSVDRGDSRKAMQSIQYAVEELKGRRNALWIYPQGVMSPNDARPIQFFSGVTHIIKKLRKVQLVPVTHRYEFIQEQRPEIFTEFGPVQYIEDSSLLDMKELNVELNQKLIFQLDLLRDAVIQKEFSDFITIQKGRESISSQVDLFRTKTQNSVR